MKRENTYSPISSLFSKQLNLSDFGFEKPALKKIKEINKDIKPNKLLKFIKYVFKYSKIVLNMYSSHFSKHDFTQPALFTLLAVKIYTRSTYRQITDLLELSDTIQKYLHLKRNINKYKPKYILADRAYDTEPIRKCINEEAKAEDQIPLKTRAKTGHYRLKSKKQFNREIYSRRNNVESIFSVIKRIFNGTNRSRSLQLSNKETKLKNTIYNIYQSTQIQ